MTSCRPCVIAAAGEKAQPRFLQFFTAHIRNPNTTTRLRSRLRCRDPSRQERTPVPPRGREDHDAGVEGDEFADIYPLIRELEPSAIGCHSSRATGITVHPKTGGHLELAQQMAGHESARSTGFYDRRDGEVTIEEVEKVGI